MKKSLFKSKNIQRVFGIILAALIGLSFAACDISMFLGGDESLTGVWEGVEDGITYRLGFPSNTNVVSVDVSSLFSGNHNEMTYTVSGREVTIYDFDSSIFATGRIYGDTLTLTDAEGNVINLTKLQ